MQLYALDDLYAVVRLEPDAEIPPWARTGHFWSVTRSDSELSVVCPQDQVPAAASAERGWCAFEVAGPLDFSLTGVVASLVTPLADEEIPKVLALGRQIAEQAQPVAPANQARREAQAQWAEALKKSEKA